MDKLASEKSSAHLGAWVTFLQRLDLRLSGASPLDGCLEPVRTRPGKHLRPRLFFLCARPDGLPDAAVHIAVGLELLHLASLVHDDLIDNTPKRRGSDALWKKKGAKSALLCGDYLFSEAFAEFDASGIPVVLPVIRRLVAGMVQAELEQEIHLFDANLPERIYWRRIKLKTARFFAVSAMLGALASGAVSSIRRHVYGFGESFGLAYQLADDLRDIFAGDLSQGMLGLPLLWLARESRQGRGVMARICRNRRLSVDDELMIKQLLQESDLTARTENLIELCLRQAESHLQEIDAWNRDRLRQMINDLRPNLLLTPDEARVRTSKI